MERLKEINTRRSYITRHSIKSFANPNRSKKKNQETKIATKTNNQNRNQTNNPNFAVYGYAN